MAIPKGYKKNFETLKKAFQHKDIRLLECTDQKTGATVITICAINRDPYTDKYVMAPLAKMFDGNPYDELAPPK